MRVLVTGANGHLGNNLLRELLSRGHEVVPMVLPGTSVEGLAGLGLIPVLGDVLNRSSLAAAFAGCEVVVNLAANYTLRYHDADAVIRPAVEGARNVLEVAAELGLGRVIHVSSTTAVGNSARPRLRSEADWNDAPLTPYYRAKTQSERVAWEVARRRGVPLVVINPAAIVGRHDYHLTPSTRLLRDLANRDVMTGTGGYNWVDVRDVALALALALERGAPGERYIVGGENLEHHQLAQLVGELTGRPARHVPGPRWLAIAAVGAASRLERLVGREPSMTLDDVRDLAGRWGWYDCSKAQAALGYTPRPARVFVEDALRWLLHRHAVRADVARALAARLPAADLQSVFAGLPTPARSRPTPSSSL